MDSALPPWIAPTAVPPGASAGWQSPGYRSGKTRAQWAKGFFVAVGLACAFEALVAGQGLALVPGIARGEVSSSQLTSFLTASNDADGFFTLCAIGLAIAFIAWLSRTVEVIPSLGGGTPPDSPRWAIAWWFVPIAFLWKPYTVVRDAWDRLCGLTRPGNSGLVVAWWLCFIGSTFLGRWASISASDAATTADLENLYLVLFVAEAIAVAAAVVGFMLVRDLQTRVDERARSLGFDAPTPHFPSVETVVGQANPTVGLSAPRAATPAATGSVVSAGYCSQCGSGLTATDQYCRSCGAQVERRSSEVG